MTARHLARIDQDTLAAIAEFHGIEAEIDTAKNLAYLTLGPTTFVAELAPIEPTTQPTGYVAPVMGGAA